MASLVGVSDLSRIVKFMSLIKIVIYALVFVLSLLFLGRFFF